MNAVKAYAKRVSILAGQAALKACTPEQVQSPSEIYSPPGAPSLTPVETSCLNVLERYFKMHGDRSVMSDDPDALRRRLSHFIGWAGNGFPTIRVTDQKAASFAMTSAPPKSVMLPRAPWGSFAIDLSEELFPFGLILYHGRSTTGVDDAEFLVFCDRGIILLRYDEDNIQNGDYPKDEITRFQKIISRVYAGICGTLYNRRREVEECERVSRAHQKRKSKLPTAWEFVIGGNVNLDCRQDVRDYLAGRARRLMTVQSLTRGHYKWQPYGPQNSLRKWIHVEPYWRGPEDAPIVQREHVL